MNKSKSIIGKFLLRYAAVIFAALIIPGIARAVEISEICSCNASAYKTKAGDYPDWIELYNPEPTEISLAGYCISNDADNPELFDLSGYKIEAGGYLLLCADGRELPFKLSASGCEVVLSGCGAVSVPPLSRDETYSLQPDGNYQITSPTPLSANAAGRDYTAPVFVRAPSFSVESGLYGEPFTLNISGYKDDAIYYTLDGSVPDESSNQYISALTVSDRSSQRNKHSAVDEITFEAVPPPSMLISKLTVIRAAARDAEGNWSKTVTGVYGVGLAGKGVVDDIPVLSITADPADMFDKDDGIYMLGKTFYEWLKTKTDADASFDISAVALSARGANFNLHGRLNEIPVSIQYIDADGVTQLSQEVGLRIRGNYSRAQANKSFQLYARSEYGGGKIEYEFWEGAGKSDQLTVRNGGNDQVLLYRDAFAHALLEPLGVPVSKSIPCAVFINGEYWGVYNLRQEQDADYIADIYGVYADDVIMIKNSEIDEGYGDELSLYTDFIKELRKLDCSKREDYARACALMDVDNYISYLAGGLYVGCTDWINFQNNMTYWRVRGEDGKWRWIYQDMDHSSGWVDAKPTPVQSLLYDDVFAALWPSAEFQAKFLGKVMDVANIVCAQARVSALIDEFDATYGKYAELKYKRFGYSYTLTDYKNAVSNLRSFYQNRPASIAEQLKETLALDMATCTISITDSGLTGAAALVDGFGIAYEKGVWSGAYFPNSPITVTAGEVAGYDFTGWYEGKTLISGDAKMSISLTGDIALTPKYARRDSCAVMSAEFTPAESGGGEYGIVSAAGGATLILDAGLTLSENDGAYSLVPDVKWEKKQGLTLRVSTKGAKNLSVNIDAAPESDAPEKWRIEYSLDGIDYEEIYEGETAGSIALPPEADDQACVYLRAEVSGKPRKGDEQAITVHSFEVYGEKMNASLLDIHGCLETCKAEMGADFDYPSDAKLAKMSESELRRLIENSYAQLAAFTVNNTAHPIKYEDVAELPALEGLEGATRCRVSAEAASMTTHISIQTGLTGQAYVYAIDEGALYIAGICEITNGALVIPARAGDYVLLEKALDEYRYTVSYSGDKISDAIVENALGGTYPDRHMWLDVTLRTRFQDGVTLKPPEEYGFQKYLYIYSVNGDALTETAYQETGGEGLFEIDGLETGRYLALGEPLEWYGEAKLIREDAEAHRNDEINRAAKFKRNMIIAAGAVLTLIISLIALRVYLRGKRKK